MTGGIAAAVPELRRYTDGARSEAAQLSTA